MIKVEEVKIRQILNSMGKKAFEVEMIANNHIKAIASSPSAIIPGRREVIEIGAVSKNKLNQIIKEICSREIKNQEDFDKILKTYLKELGSSICLPFSLAFARIMAQAQNLTLVQYIAKLANYNPKEISTIPLIAIFSGGVHNRKEKGSIQNIMIAVDVHPFSKATQPITEIYTYIENEVKKKNLLNTYGASSGMIVENMTIEEKFQIVTEAIKKLNYEKEVTIAIDVAAEHLFHEGNYIYQGKIMNANQLKEQLNQYIKKYRITYIEDPFDSNDKISWTNFKLEHKKINIIGDDLFATQEQYIDRNLADGILLKMNQVGTLTDTIHTFRKAKKENMITCVSHRSVETEDTFMCDLAVALNSQYIKIGGPRRGDRIAKYNRLLRLEEEMK